MVNTYFIMVLFGSWNQICRLFSEGVRSTMSAVQYTWPDNICPPISEPICMARSILTKSPAFNSPKLVIFKVSCIKSKLTKLPLISVTVKHTPLCATEAPICNPFSISCGISTTCVLKLAPSVIALICAVPCTMPVNIMTSKSIYL